jgi:hypothetical protein
MRKANILTLNPAVLLYVTNALVAMVTAWGLSLTATQQGAVDTVVTGVLALAVALAARPPVIPAAGAAAITVLTAFAAFGLHLPPNALSATVAVASIALGFLTHQAVTPVPAVQRGTTAEKLQLQPAASAPVQ